VGEQKSAESYKNHLLRRRGNPDPDRIGNRGAIPRRPAYLDVCMLSWATRGRPVLQPLFDAGFSPRFSSMSTGLTSAQHRHRPWPAAIRRWRPPGHREYV